MNSPKPHSTQSQEGRVFAITKRTDDELLITVYEEIGVFGVTVENLAAQVSSAGRFSRITVRINSGGGDAFQGVAIYNFLRAQRKRIHVYVDGVAASAASVVAMAGDRISMGEGAMMMVHTASALLYGTASEMMELARTLAQVNESMSAIYANRTGLSTQEVMSMMDRETWLTAQDAVDKHFADEVLEREQAQIAAHMTLAASFNLAGYTRTPERFRVAARTKPVTQDVDAIHKDHARRRRMVEIKLDIPDQEMRIHPTWREIAAEAAAKDAARREKMIATAWRISTKCGIATENQLRKK